MNRVDPMYTGVLKCDNCKSILGVKMYITDAKSEESTFSPPCLPPPPPPASPPPPPPPSPSLVQEKEEKEKGVLHASKKQKTSHVVVKAEPAPPRRYEREICSDYEMFVSGYKTIVNMLCNVVEKLKSLGNLNGTQKNTLVAHGAAILHHCQLVWNGTAVSLGVQNGSIQLPKDCMLRMNAVIFFVIHQHLDILVRVSMMEYVNEIRNTTVAKKKIPCYLMHVYMFIALIQEYDLGGAYYTYIEYELSKKKQQTKEDDALSSSSSSSSYVMPLADAKSSLVRMYENLLEGFFFKYVEYSYVSDDVNSLYRHCIKDVILEGKPPRVVQVICIYYTIKIKEFISNYEPFNVSKSVMVKKFPDKTMESKVLFSQDKMIFLVRSYRVKRGERGVYFDIHKLIGNGVDTHECGLYKKLVDYYLYDMDDTEKAIERRKVVFIKNIQKFLKLI